MDDYMREDYESHDREMHHHPRGNRLTIQPMQANNLGSDFRPLPGLPPKDAPPIRATAKEIAEEEAGVSERFFRRTRNAMFSSRD